MTCHLLKEMQSKCRAKVALDWLLLFALSECVFTVLERRTGAVNRLTTTEESSLSSFSLDPLAQLR